jgi:predicted ArsR family transcriptional regulator
MNKVQVILENIKKNVKEKEYKKILDACGELGEKPTPIQQGKYVKKLMDQLKTVYDREKITAIMQPCGYNCISDGTIERARKFYKNCSNVDDFLQKLNEQHIGGGNLRRKGNIITGIYTQCYCGLAKNAKELSPEYCNCSIGWFKKLFTSILEKEIPVKKIHTILDGEKECVFEMNIK